MELDGRFDDIQGVKSRPSRTLSTVEIARVKFMAFEYRSFVVSTSRMLSGWSYEHFEAVDVEPSRQVKLTSIVQVKEQPSPD